MPTRFRIQILPFSHARFTPSALVYSAVITSFVSAADASIVAEFAGGNGTATPDQYEGTAGDGWLTPWSTDDGIRREGTWTNTVASTSPVAGGGNYLDGRVEISGILGGDAVLWRQYAEGGATGISYADPHTISWRFRVDATSNFVPDWSQARFDTIRFHDPVDPIDDNTTWWIELANPDTPYTQWQFFTFIGGTAFTNIPTDVRFVIGDVYEFQVALSDAATGTWDGTVTNLDWDASDGGVASTTITDMATGSLQTSGGFKMETRILDLGENAFFVDGSIDFSLDSLRISGPAAIPEARTLLIWSSLALGAVVAQWWRNRRAVRE